MQVDKIRTALQDQTDFLGSHSLLLPLYFAQERRVLQRGKALVLADHVTALPWENPVLASCRMRSLGCVPCSGAIRSEAATVPAIIQEILAFRRSERENRVIDYDQEGSMEVKKREGYF